MHITVMLIHHVQCPSSGDRTIGLIGAVPEKGYPLDAITCDPAVHSWEQLSTTHLIPLYSKHDVHINMCLSAGSTQFVGPFRVCRALSLGSVLSQTSIYKSHIHILAMINV
jgi:hypothetical protein